MPDIITDLIDLRTQLATILDDEVILGVLTRAAAEIERLRAYEECTGDDQCTCYAHIAGMRYSQKEMQEGVDHDDTTM
jgi:hypothetical protein